ncbi:penicillin-binding protein 1B [Agarivorans sp. 1_MG-2023]|uniref:penicillin-binding protein 1B n=1 Tax=Agarivorans sp. 1_MG-2023 TaxID=3062634 RepID=UPI0026E12E77|nr:penicillin-binding protein 1B [Agarivorans sp. 1_MG-2023]MDO6763612.1 penicillin-binding protein 1B [Agarivorans sp. 1_MG-2023]
MSPKQPNSSAKKPSPKKTTAKKPASKAKRSPAKKTTKPRSAKKNTPKVSLGKRLWRIGWKLAVVGIVVLVAWGVVLDRQIQQRFAGDKWQLPAAVYGRELQLYPGLRLSRKELQDELALLNYRKVKRAKRGGEYAVSETKIEVVRRQFEFADGVEPELPMLLTFSPSRLAKIQHRDSGEEIAQTRLDPVLLERLNVTEQEDRLFVPLNEIPESLKLALILTEDRQFYQHDGVSPMAIARALVVNLRAGRTVQGGSTITQQLAKNFFLTRDRTLWRKLQEAYMALLIDFRYSKDEILESYFNEVYLGQNGSNAVHGIGLASYFYFGRPVTDLSVEQVALLVAIIKGPSYYDPWRREERALNRRDIVLRILAEEGEISAERYKLAVKQPLGLSKRGSMGYQKTPGFVSLVRRELKQYANDWSSHNGVKVFTTLDPLSQRHAQTAAQSVLEQLDKGNKKQLQTAMVISERHSGAIRALIGGREKNNHGFNRALDARRQIGSLVKPFVYLTALEQGHQLGELLDNSPLSVPLDDGTNWQPNNYDKTFSEPVMLVRALAESLNVPTVRLGLEVGVDSVVDTLKLAGLQENTRAYPSLLLGSLSLSPFQMAQLYQTLGGDGEYRPLYAVHQVNDGHGNVLYRADSNVERRWSEMSNFLTLYGMSQVTRSGTARSLKWRIPKVDLAGKTGTTNDLRDSWYVGIDQREIVTVWVGRDDNKPAAVTGSSAALPVYAAYLKTSYPQSLRAMQPDQLSWVHFAKSNGHPTSAGCGETQLLPAPSSQAELAEGCVQHTATKAKTWLQSIFN